MAKTTFYDMYRVHTIHIIASLVIIPYICMIDDVMPCFLLNHSIIEKALSSSFIYLGRRSLSKTWEIVSS